MAVTLLPCVPLLGEMELSTGATTAAVTVTVADAETLVVTLYGDAFASGIRPEQAINAMAVVYVLVTMLLLGIALFFVKPTQFVVRLKGQ